MTKKKVILSEGDPKRFVFLKDLPMGDLELWGD